ncbi:TPA: iron-containing alcohol dehydrogenase [Legionella anisa]|nr:iron-containing alcohol dehydrogenase [Legionella anisa]MCW8425233.1 iron-containing alcohol dehydrogenase [Legionella anisa]MCW8449337.1 iron-containing alcohol dehydrogenase [Legionella anisa]
MSYFIQNLQWPTSINAATGMDALSHNLGIA